MLVFIDDSGDPGFKHIGEGSSRYFVISAILFSDELEAEKVAVAIKELRRDLGFSDRVEFKFNGSRRDVREQFLRTIHPFSFRVRSIVVDKTVIRSEELRNDKNSFYSYVIKMLLKHSNDTVLDAKIRIDGSGDRIFRKNFLTYLRKQLNSRQKRIIGNCKLVDSKENVLVQMADMIAGSVRRSYHMEYTDREVYKGIIKKHIDDEWKFQ